MLIIIMMREKKKAKSFIKFTFLMLNYLFRIALRLTTLNKKTKKKKNIYKKIKYNFRKIN
jgi:hypothetical protein